MVSCDVISFLPDAKVVLELNREEDARKFGKSLRPLPPLRANVARASGKLRRSRRTIAQSKRGRRRSSWRSFRNCRRFGSRRYDRSPHSSLKAFARLRRSFRPGMTAGLLDRRTKAARV